MFTSEEQAKRIIKNYESTRLIESTLDACKGNQSMPKKDIIELIDDLKAKGLMVIVVNSPTPNIPGYDGRIKTYKIGTNHPLELPTDAKIFYFYQWYRTHPYLDDSIIRFDVDVALPFPPKVHRVYMYERAVEQGAKIEVVGTNEFGLFHDGRWVAKTTKDGIKFNPKIPLWRKVAAVFQMMYYRVKGDLTNGR